MSLRIKQMVNTASTIIKENIVSPSKSTLNLVGSLRKKRNTMSMKASDIHAALSQFQNENHSSQSEFSIPTTQNVGVTSPTPKSMVSSIENQQENVGAQQNTNTTSSSSSSTTTNSETPKSPLSDQTNLNGIRKRKSQTQLHRANSSAKKLKSAFLQSQIPQTTMIDRRRTTAISPQALQEEAERGRKEEIVLTEERYVSDLELVFQNLYSPLYERPQIVSQSVVREIFSNWTAILTLHQDLLKDLRKDDIITAFEKHISNFKMYTTYCATLERAKELLTHQRISNSAFKRFIDDAMKNKLFRQLDLESFLLSPFQRITRYSLLLSELAKVSKAENQAKLTSLSDRVRQIVQVINEEKRKRDNVKKISEILATLSSKSILQREDFAELHLLREGPLNDKKKGAVHLYLFENGEFWICANVKKSSQREIRSILKVQTVEPATLAECSFKVFATKMDEKKASIKTFEFQASNENDKTGWANEFAKVVPKRI